MSVPAREVPDRLQDLFGRARRRIRAVWLLATSEAFGPYLVGAALVVALTGWLRPWSWPEPAAIGLLVVGVILLIVVGVGQRLPDIAVARTLDRGLDTEDALVTALEFAPTDTFGPRVHARAAQFVNADVAEAIPTPWRPKPLAVIAALLVALGVVLVVGNPQDDARAQRAADLEVIEELAEEFEERADATEADPELGAEGDALAEQLRQLAEELRQADDLDAAIDELTETQDELLSSVDSQDLSERAATEGLQRTLDANPLAAGASAAAQLEALSGATSDLTPEERDALAERLAELAATQEAGDEATADALAEAAEALEAGDAAAAAAALALSLIHI